MNGWQAALQPVNLESLFMQTTTPQLSPNLQAPLERYQAARARFETTRDEADRLDAEIQKQRKAAEAAENEAQHAREEVAQLLRKPGSSAKEIQQLKAKERAAYTLAEDYRSLMAELEAAHDEASKQVGTAKEDEQGQYTALLGAYADALMEQANAVLEPLFRAIRVQECAYVAQTGRVMADWEYRSDDARSAALAVMYGHIKRGLSSFEFDVGADAVFEAAQRPSGRDRFKEASVAARHRDRVLQEQAAAR